jgi:hypothetical protein
MNVSTEIGKAKFRNLIFECLSSRSLALKLLLLTLTWLIAQANLAICFLILLHSLLQLSSLPPQGFPSLFISGISNHSCVSAGTGVEWSSET